MPQVGRYSVRLSEFEAAALPILQSASKVPSPPAPHSASLCHHHVHHNLTHRGRGYARPHPQDVMCPLRLFFFLHNCIHVQAVFPFNSCGVALAAFQCHNIWLCGAPSYMK